MKKQFIDVKNVEHDGLVLVGTDDPDEWADGIMKMLVDDGGLVKDMSCFDDCFFVETTNGRKDTIIPFKEQAMINMRNMTGRKGFVSTAFWVYAYIENFTNVHAIKE